MKPKALAIGKTCKFIFLFRNINSRFVAFQSIASMLETIFGAQWQYFVSLKRMSGG